MDLSLQQMTDYTYQASTTRFNPCFNGSFTSTHLKIWLVTSENLVSILVLMDLSLQLVTEWFLKVQNECFNPCFNGSFTSTNVEFRPEGGGKSFNPCFNGSFTSTGGGGGTSPSIMYVSILVLMDLSLQLCSSLAPPTKLLCFNPCFNGSFTSTHSSF